MLYPLLRWLSSVALRWFYREIEVRGREHIPRDGPLLVAMNHPNALVDALVAGFVLPRRVTLTAMAPLFARPLVRPFLRAAGVVPLWRLKDEMHRRRSGGARLPSGAARLSSGAEDRNAAAFREILHALTAGHAVLLFPEGITHDGSQMAPLRTGLARLALQASDAQGIRGVQVLPVGLTFERKDEPRSRIFVEIGAPLALDGWPRPRADAVGALTAELNDRLRAVTLNFESADDARGIRAVSRVLSRVLHGPAPVRAGEPPLGAEIALARRADRVRLAIDREDRALTSEARALERRANALYREIAAHDLELSDVAIATGTGAGARFALREAGVALLGAPVAWWGHVHHWLPLRLARAYGERTARSREDPATNTILAGMGLMLAMYAILLAVAWMLAGPWLALLYVVTLPGSATWDLRHRERTRRAWRRARAYLHFRRNPELRERLAREAKALGEEAAALEMKAGVQASRPGRPREASAVRDDAGGAAT